MCIRFFGGFLLAAALAAAQADPSKTYQQHCAACHGADRLGGTGPALLPENLERLKKADALKVIRDGRPATQMRGFARVLAPGEIEALSAQIYTPVQPTPRWGEAEIRASRVVHHPRGTLPDKPAFAADPLNLFIVVEAGDHHVTILDGDPLEPIHPFPSRLWLHRGPQVTPHGGHVQFALRRKSVA